MVYGGVGAQIMKHWDGAAGCEVRLGLSVHTTGDYRVQTTEQTDDRPPPSSLFKQLDGPSIIFPN